MPDMRLDPERMPVNTHPLYPVMANLLRAMNQAAYYDSGAWVINREEALLLVENALREEMAPPNLWSLRYSVEATASTEPDTFICMKCGWEAERDCYEWEGKIDKLSI